MQSQGDRTSALGFRIKGKTWYRVDKVSTDDSNNPTNVCCVEHRETIGYRANVSSWCIHVVFKYNIELLALALLFDLIPELV